MEYGIAILKSFTSERSALGITEMSDIVGISRSTTHRYVITLVELGYLEQDTHRKYRLAGNAARPGLNLLDTIRQRHPAKAILEDLRDETGCTVGMGLLDGTQVLYVHRIFSHNKGQFEADGNRAAGAHIPSYCTAMGKALLASLSDGEFHKLLSSMHLERFTPNTIMTRAALTASIEQSRKDKFAVGNEEYIEGARSFAVPIPDKSGTSTYAIELTSPADTYTLKQLVAFARRPVKRAAELISL
jgi:IclR family transcriptional regulator, pca regulon regulatory protein